jgi:hypothetical protein
LIEVDVTQAGIRTLLIKPFPMRILESTVSKATTEER